MAVTSAEEFFAVLEKSKLLMPVQLAQARSAAAPDDTPRTIAKRLAREELITRWQAGQLLAGRSSFYLGKYRLIELLGRGGMGSVFLAQHVTMNRRAALKIIARQVSQDPVSLNRFLSDARAIAALDHPNILQAYSVDSEGQRYYLVMEYVEGVDLQRLVEEDGPLDCERATDYVRQAADGLDHAHRQNMIHGDIRPSNLLVNMQGVVKIIDLGLAWLDGDPSATLDWDRQASRSVDYLAPERTLRGASPVARTDIYSLGCTLHFLLTGHVPFPAGTPSERILKHQTQELPDICAERPEVPAALAAICRRMAANRPEDRYQTAAEVSRALAEWQASLPPIEQAARLPKAQPLEDWEDAESFGIDFDEAVRRPMGGKGKKEGVLAAATTDGPESPAGADVAVKKEPSRRVLSRQRVLLIVLAVLLALLGTIVAIVVVSAL